MRSSHIGEATRRLLRSGRFVLRLVQAEGVGVVLRKLYERLRRSAVRDPFDTQHGVDTSGEISLFELEIASPNEQVGIHYQASPVQICEKLLASLPIRYQDFTFIDLGAGKGRVLLVASRFPFKRVIGVEFAGQLVETARKNIARFGSKAEVVHADVADYQLPAGNLVVYLYNPFGPSVLHPFLNSLQQMNARSETYLIYLNPIHSSCVEEFAHELYTIDGAKVYRLLGQQQPVPAVIASSHEQV